MKTAQVTPYAKKSPVRVFRDFQVRGAQDMGTVGVILYANPQTDGKITADKGHKPFLICLLAQRL